MKFRNLAIVLMLTPVLAFAGKAERDFVTNQVDPAVKEATTALKSSCGCDVKFNVKFDTYKDTDELVKIKYFANAIKDGSKAYCTDAASKAAICTLKTIEFSKSNEASFTFKDGKGVGTSDSSANPSWDMVTRAVDK